MELGNTEAGVRLTFINQSNDQMNSDVVIFQKNAAGGQQVSTVAWLVIQNCGQGDSHPFVYPAAMEVGASDSWGNFTPLLDAPPGQSFAVVYTASGDQLVPDGPATSPTEVQVENQLQLGAINAGIYRNRALLAHEKSLAPGQIAAFAFEPTIWIGAVSQAEQGQVLDPAIVGSINTQLSLFGIASADIVMTGGGPGENASPFAFTMQNIVMA